jgi:hypothetical protein
MGGIVDEKAPLLAGNRQFVVACPVLPSLRPHFPALGAAFQEVGTKVYALDVPRGKECSAGQCDRLGIFVWSGLILASEERRRDTPTNNLYFSPFRGWQYLIHNDE